ncbi:MAG TPA: signal peptide peptidase SppA [Rhizomicrobium sp.]
MVAFLRWAKSIGLGVLNGVAKFAAFVILLLAVFLIIGAIEGDGLPSNMVLALDLRSPIKDSSNVNFSLGGSPVTVMDIVLALDAARNDPRVKGVILRAGSANLSIAQAEELGAAFKSFEASGKFVIAHSQGFQASGLGDYLTTASASEIWMQPLAPFTAAGEGGSEFFLRGLLDKIDAEPQIVKRSDYKSAADQFMEKNITPADREQLTRLMQSWYDSATAGAAQARHLSRERLVAALQESPQFTEAARAAGLIDRIGYDDDAEQAALTRAGSGAKLVPIGQFVRVRSQLAEAGFGPRIALIQASGEIQEGSAGNGLFDSNDVIAGDSLSKAIREAAADKSVKAIVLRVDSPGGSVTASDQILDAVKKAQAAGKPVVVSMASVAASGGYYISLSANRIVAEPGTITGSIGVLTGKVSVGRSLALAGIGTDSVGIGKNALYNSEFQPFTPDQLASLNREADAIYADFTQKVAAGRKLPLAAVQGIAKGRVWSGADASRNGLVDQLGGFWTAVGAAKKLSGLPADSDVVFRRFPRQKSVFQAVSEAFGNSTASARALQGFVTVMNAAPMRVLIDAVGAMPRGGVELRATNLPR